MSRGHQVSVFRQCVRRCPWVRVADMCHRYDYEKLGLASCQRGFLFLPTGSHF